jgi:hypothetical protein
VAHSDTSPEAAEILRERMRRMTDELTDTLREIVARLEASTIIAKLEQWVTELGLERMWTEALAG